jgi:origin recognition complex subunit 3
MCHFYANPLSVVGSGDDDFLRKSLQPETLEALRTLPSFKSHVEAVVEGRQLSYSLSLLDDDKVLVNEVVEAKKRRNNYSKRLLRVIHLMKASGVPVGNFIDLYISTLADGVDLAAGEAPFLESIRQKQPNDVISLLQGLLDAIRNGNEELELAGWASDAKELVGVLSQLRDEIEALTARAKEEGKVLRSKYSATRKVLRTTVVAQKVQLSQDTAQLTAEDKSFTEAIDRLTEALTKAVSCERISDLFLHETWVYDSKMPHKDVFIPRPGATAQRALSRPHDYLACSCCSEADGAASSSLPAASILFLLYSEAGSLVNVSDLWSAFYALVGDEDKAGLDERAALVRFYQGLAELKNMGFVKQSKKKADHIAKVKWL